MAVRGGPSRVGYPRRVRRAVPPALEAARLAYPQPVDRSFIVEEHVRIVAGMSRGRCILYQMHLPSQNLERRGKALVSIRTRRLRESVEVGLTCVLPGPARSRLTWILSPQDGGLADRAPESRLRPGRCERIVEVIQEAGEVVFVHSTFDKPFLQRSASNRSVQPP